MKGTGLKPEDRGAVWRCANGTAVGAAVASRDLPLSRGEGRPACCCVCVTVWARGHRGAGTSGSACERGKGVCLVGGGDARPVLVCERGDSE